MKNVNVQIVSPRRHAIRAGVFASVALVALLFAACDMSVPSGQTASALADAKGGSWGSGGSGGGSGSGGGTSAVALGSAANFAVLGATTVTNTGASVITGDLGVSPGTAITGFQQVPFNRISGPGTVTDGLGLVTGTIYANGPVAAQAQVDAHIAYLNLLARPVTQTFDPIQELGGMTLTPGVYKFPSSAFINGTLTLDFQGNSSAVFVFIIGSTLITGPDPVTLAPAQVIIENGGQAGNVYWAVGSSATIAVDSQFAGNIIAYTSITIKMGASMSGSAIALGGAVTLDTNNISVSASSGGGTVPPPVVVCKDFVTGGGWIDGKGSKGHWWGWGHNEKNTFGVSGGIKNGKFWGQLSYTDHGKDGLKVKSKSVTAYIVIDAVTRQIEGTATINGRGSYTYKVIVVDKGERGRNDSFSIELSNGYKASGKVQGGNIQLHSGCTVLKDKNNWSHDGKDKEDYVDSDESTWSE